MPINRKAKTAYLDEKKRERVLLQGCEFCGAGRLEGGFERYWEVDRAYEARRFVFKYIDHRGSDVPVAKLPRLKKTTLKTIDDALARCVILCRSCADPRRTRKDDQCQKSTTEISPSSS